MKDRLLIITMILMISFSVHAFLYDNNNFAYALSCERINMTQSLDNADAVFFGKAISKEYVPNDRNNKHQDAVVQFSVIEAFKGVTEPQISVISEEWLWGFNFTKGAEYVVFADKNGEMLRVQDCAPTGTLVYVDIHDLRNASQKYIVPPLQQLAAGIAVDEIKCRDGLFLIMKSLDGSPACVKDITKQQLMDRGWIKSANLAEIKNNPDLIKLNIIRTWQERFFALYPDNMCTFMLLDRLSEQNIKRYQNEHGLNNTKILQITSGDLKEIPPVDELTYTAQHIELPYNKDSTVYLDTATFVEYEFFLMNKSIAKYGDTKADYFISFDEDIKQRLADPKKNGFENDFHSPWIVYDNKIYDIMGTIFSTTNEDDPRFFLIYPQDNVNDRKFITLTDDDMKSVPKLKEAIESIGTIKESITLSKGIPEDEWSKYKEWFGQKSQDRLGTDWFDLMRYDGHLYSLEFRRC